MAAKNIIKKNRFIDRQERLSYAKVSEGLHYLSPFKYKKPSGYFWPDLKDKSTNPYAHWTFQDLENLVYRIKILVLVWDNRNEKFVDSQCPRDQVNLLTELINEQKRFFFDKKLIPNFTSKSWENYWGTRKERKKKKILEKLTKNENKPRG